MGSRDGQVIHRFGTIANLPRDAGLSLAVFMDLLLEDAYNKEGIRILIWQVNYSSSPTRMSSSETQLHSDTNHGLLRKVGF